MSEGTGLLLAVLASACAFGACCLMALWTMRLLLRWMVAVVLLAG